MFFLTPILNKYLGNEKLGVWILLYSITNFLTLTSFGFNQNFNIEIIKEKNNADKINRIISTSFFIILLFSAISIPIFIVIYSYFEVFFKISPILIEKSKYSFVFVYLVFLTTFISQFFYNLFLCFNKLHLRNLIEAVKIILYFVGIILLIHCGKDIIEFSILNLLITSIFYLVIYFGSKQIIDYRISIRFFDVGILKSFMRPSLYFFLINISYQIIIFADTLLIPSLIATSQIVFYTVALRIPDFSMRLIFKISDVKIPKITALYRDKNYYGLLLLHNRLFWITFAVSFPVAVLLFFGGEYILKLWMGEEFNVHLDLVRLFSVNMFTQCMFHVFGIFLQSMGHHKRSALLTLIGVILYLGLSIWLAPVYGIFGIGLATTITQFIVALGAIDQLYVFLFKNIGKSNFSLLKLR